MQQRHVDHRDLVDDDELGLELVLLAALEAAAGGIGLEQTVQGLGLEPGGLEQPLGRPAGWCCQGDVLGPGAQDGEDGVEQRGLADAGAAGDHQQLRTQRQPYGFSLARGQDQAGLALDPGDGLLRIDGGPGRRAVGKAEQSLGNALLGAVKPGQEHAGALADRIGHHAALGQLQLQGRRHDLGRNLQQGRRLQMQLVRRQAAMTLVHGLGQGVADPGPGADHRRLLDA